MPLTCPRCSTDVPDTALYCPYCNLPKPKRGFTASAEEPRTPPAPVVSSRRREMKNRPSRRTKNTKRTEKATRSRSFKVPAVSALVALLGIVVYVFVVPLVYSTVAEPKAILASLEKLRRAPSNEEGLTIDARLSRDVERSRRVGNLVEYQGWTVKPIKGTKSKVLLVFSYDERDNQQQRAEWLADLTHNTFTPQNELAVSISQ